MYIWPPANRGNCNVEQNVRLAGRYNYQLHNIQVRQDCYNNEES